MRHDWFPLGVTALFVFGLLMVWAGSRDVPADVRPAQFGVTSPAPTR